MIRFVFLALLAPVFLMAATCRMPDKEFVRGVDAQWKQIDPDYVKLLDMAGVTREMLDAVLADPAVPEALKARISDALIANNFRGYTAETVANRKSEAAELSRLIQTARKASGLDE